MLTLNDANFSEELKKSTLPVVVDFYADWCGPCKMMSPIFEQLSGEMGDKFVFAKLNVDQSSATSQAHDVSSIPSFLVFKEGKEVGRVMGLRPMEDFKNELLKFSK